MEENKRVEATEIEAVATEESAIANEDVILEPHEEPKLPVLEEHKKSFAKSYRGSRIVSYVSSAIVIAIIIVAYTVVFPLQPNGTWAGIILIIIALVGSLVFSKYHRNKLTKRVRKYMADYNGEVNNIALKDSKVSNYTFDFAGEISGETFKEARLLKDIINTNSRNLITYDVGRFHVEASDFVAYRPDGKRAKAAFLGKLVTATSTEIVEGRVVFYLKPDPAIFKDVAGPDDLEDLELLEDKPRYRLYASNKELKKKLPLRAINALLKIVPNGELADLTVALYQNKVLMTLTYSDALMVVPYKEDIPVNAILLYHDHLTAINEFFTLL